ncbi:dolichyl-phosphate beta-glucosyltransferase [Halobacteriota archaeon]
MRISIIFPAYNEANRIEAAVEKTIDVLDKMNISYEIIIAEDGSTDGTGKIAKNLAENFESIKHIHSDVRLGRGGALNNAFKNASGDIMAYMDVDLATDIEQLDELIGSVIEGYDFATGSRMLPESKTKRPWKRDIASRGYNFLIRTLLRSEINDHQCGFKSFKKEPLFDLLDEIKDQHWFWDTELLVRAQRKSYSIKEFPVNWAHGGATKVELIKDVIGMGFQAFRLWWELDISKT